MTAKALMIQGTGSDVGKSIITAGLCRLARRQGLRVAPFKPQNMSNNAAACINGGEIGRAQALQAKAAGIAPHTDFNPVLLKPQSDRTSQIILHGKAINVLDAQSYMATRDNMLAPVLESFDRLATAYDLVLVEGAGSPAEINLRDRDIANMGFARAAGVPVVLIGDIEKGGVIASLVGTKFVLSSDDAAMITGFIVNKFRGDPNLFTDGVKEIETRCDWPCFGVIPWLDASARLPAEDAVALTKPTTTNSGKIRIVAPMLSRMANFDDADPLRFEPNVDFDWVAPGAIIPRDADVIILFGTKSTIGELAFLRAQGWDHDIIAHARAGGHVLGICGGYQMLGDIIDDPRGVDGVSGCTKGLGLLRVETMMNGTKTVRPTTGYCAITQTPISGYEIHVGNTTGADIARPMLTLSDRHDGARSQNGRVEGTYVHGLFANDQFRASWLEQRQKGASSIQAYDGAVEAALDNLADGLAEALDIEKLFAAARPPGWSPALSDF